MLDEPFVEEHEDRRIQNATTDSIKYILRQDQVPDVGGEGRGYQSHDDDEEPNGATVTTESRPSLAHCKQEDHLKVHQTLSHINLRDPLRCRMSIEYIRSRMYQSRVRHFPTQTVHGYCSSFGKRRRKTENLFIPNQQSISNAERETVTSSNCKAGDTCIT